MSRYEVVTASCTGKQGFGTKKHATAALPKKGGAACVYKCKFCNLWHVGRRSKPRGPIKTMSMETYE